MTPVAQCWRMKQENGTNVAVLYYGYSNAGSTSVTIADSLLNFFQGPPETDIDPITNFLPGFHGFAQLLPIGPDLSGGNSVQLSWVLNNLYATINTANASQECQSALSLTLTLTAPGATAVNQSDLTEALELASGLTSAQIVIDASTPASTKVNLLQGGPISQFEAAAVIYSAFTNPNDESLRGSLEVAFNVTVTNIAGASTPQDAPGTSSPPPVTMAPVAPTYAPFSVPAAIIPVAHCWEPVSDALANYSYFYFGYQSTYTTVQSIEPGTSGNTFLGAPDTDLPFPVFYPGINGFVSRLRVPTSSLIQWNLAGYAVLLDGADANFACDSGIAGLASVGVWASGTVSDSAAAEATLAVSTVSRLPESNVQGSWTNVSTGGFRALFTLNAGNNETAYTSMWRTVSDFHLAANSTLGLLWTGALGANADNYSCEGTPNDVIGQPLPSTDNVFVPISHCWMQGLTANTKYVYYGFLSNYEHTLSYLPSANNWIANAQSYQVPSTFAPGYNGFSASLTVTGAAATAAGTNVSWNLAGFTAGMDVTDASKQCNPLRTISFTITYTGVILDSFDQYAAAAQTQAYLNTLINVRTLTVQLDPTVGGFLATVTATPDTTQAGSQYQGVTSFIQQCNSLNSYTVRNKLSSLAGNATITVCQGNGIVRDTLGTSGTTQDAKNYGVQSLEVSANCYTPNAQGITAYFGYKLNSDFYVTVPSTISGTGASGALPAVFLPGNNPYSVRIGSSGNTVTWNVGTLKATINQDSPRCEATSANAILSFERAITSPPDMTPILNYVSTITSYPNNLVTGSWNFLNQENFVLTVTFQTAASLADATLDPIAAASTLVRQVTDNSTATQAISNAAGLHLYSAVTSTSSDVPVDPTPIAPVFAPVLAPSTPSAPITPSIVPPVAAPARKKGPDGVVVFGIIIGVLLGVGLIGGGLFFICKYKGACREDIETRPLLAE